jgi:nucleoside-diphosphate-sugar epimerase
MNVLVTGATGFVGGHLVDQLLARGDNVTVLVRSRQRAAPIGGRGARLVEGDLADTGALARAVAGQDVIYHVAGLTGAPTERDLMAANRDGTARLVEACLVSGTPPRFVLVSSLAAGGPSRRGVPHSSGAEQAPVTAYGRSKLAAEIVVQQSGLPWVAVRPPIVYGPRDRDSLFDIFRAARLGIAPVFGDGAMELSFVQAADLGAALVVAGEHPDVVGQIYYVAHPEIITTDALLALVGAEVRRTIRPVRVPRWAARAALHGTGALARLTGRRTILHPDKIHELYQEAWTADPTHFVTATGWRPGWNLVRGLADARDWYQRHGWL